MINKITGTDARSPEKCPARITIYATLSIAVMPQRIASVSILELIDLAINSSAEFASTRIVR
jgi:hypothetical protein